MPESTQRKRHPHFPSQNRSLSLFIYTKGSSMPVKGTLGSLSRCELPSSLGILSLDILRRWAVGFLIRRLTLEPALLIRLGRRRGPVLWLLLLMLIHGRARRSELLWCGRRRLALRATEDLVRYGGVLHLSSVCFPLAPALAPCHAM